MFICTSVAGNHPTPSDSVRYMQPSCYFVTRCCSRYSSYSGSSTNTRHLPCNSTLREGFSPRNADCCRICTALSSSWRVRLQAAAHSQSCVHQAGISAAALPAFLPLQRDDHTAPGPGLTSGAGCAMLSLSVVFGEQPHPAVLPLLPDMIPAFKSAGRNRQRGRPSLRRGDLLNIGEVRSAHTVPVRLTHG